MTVDVERQSLLLRGALDMCLLALLAERPSHAYDLSARLSERGIQGVGYGTLYPLVTRLRRLGLVDERVEESPSGPPRKVFTPSAAGAAALTSWAAQWLASTSAVHALLTSTGALPLVHEETR